MIRLIVHRDAEADLLAIARTDAAQAAHIGICLEELNGDLELLDLLCEGEAENGILSVGPFYRLKRRGLQIKRLKVRALEETEKWCNYRILITHDGSLDVIWILGIVHRSFSYDPKHPISARIAAECQRLGVGVRRGRYH